MTMLIEFRGDCFLSPLKWCRLDLDSKRDREMFDNIDFTLAAEHLHPGETIQIRCVKREERI